MIGKIVIAIVCFASISLNAQNGTVSPYSYFGIGDLRSASTVENQMMGGIAIYADSIHLNLQNPASYGKLGLKTQNKVGLMVYAAGISYKQLTLKSATAQEKSTVANLDYLALGFSLGKGFGVGFGIMPYSSVGYNLVSRSENTNNAQVVNTYFGTGGLSRVYLSAGYEFTKDFSFGITASFNFGTLDNQRTQIVENVQFGTLDNRTSRINGMDFNYALNYTPTIKGKNKLYTSIRVNTQANLTSRNTQQIGSFSTANLQNIEVLNVDLLSRGLEDTEVKIPAKTTFGLGYGEDMKWFLGAEYSFQSKGTYTTEFIQIDNLAYQNASSFAFGGYFVPDHTSFNSYLKRITYRAGLRVDKTGMIVDNTEINNFGITFGVGLPLGRSFSNLNIGFEFGKRGTTKNDLIEENYFKINLGLSLNDLWFQKRKIN